MSDSEEKLANLLRKHLAGNVDQKASQTQISYELEVKTTGKGVGTVTRNPDAESYAQGEVVFLTANAKPGSKFIRWINDATGSHPVCNLRMDRAKLVYVEFGLADLTTEVGNKLEQIETRIPTDISTCAVVMDSAKSVAEEFVALDSFTLTVATHGTGSGTVLRSVDAAAYVQNSNVSLVAIAGEGSIFNGWGGDAKGLDAVCTISIHSHMHITAEFVKLDIPTLGIEVRFDTVANANMKGGETAFILYFSIANNGDKQVRVELPFASYVTCLGEEIEQTWWLSNLLLGNKGSTLRAGTFRKMGLVFDKSRLTAITNGDSLHVTVFQSKPARRLGFTFRCTDTKLRQFTLIKAVAELTQALDENGETSLEKLEMLQRISLLEEGMQDILRRLDALQTAPTAVPSAALLAPTQTLPEVLAWLGTQDSVSIATLRQKLLPLDLMPSAVIDDINERAYDLTGETALDDDGDAVTVQRGVMLQVLAAWDE